MRRKEKTVVLLLPNTPILFKFRDSLCACKERKDVFLAAWFLTWRRSEEGAGGGEEFFFFFFFFPFFFPFFFRFFFPRPPRSAIFFTFGFRSFFP